MKLTNTFLFLFISLSNFSQVKGEIVDEHNQPLEMVDVVVKNTKKGTYTNVRGNFYLNLKEGNYTLISSLLGYKSQEKMITVKKETVKKVFFKLKENLFIIDEVIIAAKTKAQITREKSYAVETVNMKEIKNISTDINAILGKVSGVNIRQSGGLGSNLSLSLNGFYGNQIRTFIDGIPMHYFGSSLSLNNFSANLVEGIEVYKGVVPIHLSSDALGGAINVITNKSKRNFLDASYSVGSFNTHRYSVNGQYRAKNGFTTRLKSFYNYSDNNYKVPIHPRNKNTGKLAKESTLLKHFHDAYSSQMIWTELGVTGKKYADELMVGILASNNYKEIQQFPNTIGEAITPYGEVDYTEEKIITNVSFRKKNIVENLSVTSYFVGVFSDRTLTDISDYRYDWFGNKELNYSSAEIGSIKRALTLNEQNYLTNINAEYALNEYNSIATNYSLNHFKIQGDDKFKTRNQNQTQFENPSILKKQIASFSYTNNFNNLKTSLFGKYYFYDLKTIETNYYGEKIKDVENSLNDFGYGLATSYQFKNLQLKTSYEKAFRFPEVVELFGNGIETLPNPNLQPEKSHNVNFGFVYREINIHNKFLVSVNSFLRKGENYIYPTQRGLYTEYKNTRKALTKGIDLSVNYNYKNRFLMNLNGSFYDKRNINKWKDEAQTKMNILYDIRFPNEPYFSGNTSISYKRENSFYTDDSFVASVTQNYVHDFFYSWDNLGSKDKEIVPVQYTNDLDLVYSLQKQRYNISFGIINIWDKAVYDNYKQTKPGRMFNLKLRYFIN